MLEVRSSAVRRFTSGMSMRAGDSGSFKIGSSDVLLLDQARRLGRSAVHEALLGSAPQARRQDLWSIPTLNDFGRRYLPHARANKQNWHIDEMNLRLHILHALGRLTVDENTSEHIAHVIEEMR